MTRLVRIAVLTLLALFGAVETLAQSINFQNQLPIEGYSQPGRLATLAAPTSGIVAERVAEEGAIVSEGDCIARLDNTIHTELIKLARIAMDSQGEHTAAKAELQASRTRLTRIEELAKRSHASQVELIQAREQVSVAEAGVLVTLDKQRQRKAEYEKLIAEAELYCISAPFNGVLVEYTKEKGEYVGPAEPSLCVLAALDELSIEFLVPRPRRKEVGLHKMATVLFTDNDKTAVGKVIYISPYPNGESNLYTVKVRVSNAEREHEAGMRCQLIAIGSADSMATAKKVDTRRIERLSR